MRLLKISMLQSLSTLPDYTHTHLLFQTCPSCFPFRALFVQLALHSRNLVPAVILAIRQESKEAETAQPVQLGSTAQALVTRSLQVFVMPGFIAGELHTHP